MNARALSKALLWGLLPALFVLGWLVRPVASQQSLVSVVAVSPDRVANVAPVTLTISGSDFAPGAVVSLVGYGGLATTLVNTTTLTAVLPAAVSPGRYAVAVANPGDSPVILASALLVMGPTAVQPNNVSNTVATELVITGDGFVDGSVVILDNYGALATTFVSANMLRAQLPAGVPAGVYAIRVVNPDATSSVLNNALTVTAPPATPGPTNTPNPTNTPAPTAFVRPIIVVQSYGASSSQITPGSDLAFEMTLVNSGQIPATNVVATFSNGDFVPRETGGVRALGNLAGGQTVRFWQPLFATSDLRGKSNATLEVKVNYTDANGTSYTDSFALTFPVVRQAGAAAPTATPTATPTPTPTVTPTPGPRLRPQLLIGGYQTSVARLVPGARFSLDLTISNLGNADARRVTMILGGGTSGGGSVIGTPEPGGLSGAGGEFTNFAPVGASNVSFLGDLPQGGTLAASEELIVNASTKPGAYPVKVSFVYSDNAGSNFVDDQVITLLVYGQPSLDINFYFEPPPFFAGQPNQAPLQIVNIGRSTGVFGNFTVTAAGAQFNNNTAFVGSLEPGGFFPLDAMVIPNEPGTLELIVRVGYVDDFNQPQVISKTLTVEVLEAPVFEPPPDMGGPGDGGPPPMDPSSETLAQKIWRFVRGMLGLSSGIQQPSSGGFSGPGPIDGPGGGASGPPPGYFGP